MDARLERKHIESMKQAGHKSNVNLVPVQNTTRPAVDALLGLAHRQKHNALDDVPTLVASADCGILYFWDPNKGSHEVMACLRRLHSAGRLKGSFFAARSVVGGEVGACYRHDDSQTSRLFMHSRPTKRTKF